ncbi:MAG TPA: hypothetical protein VNW30_02740 [Opitutaceae bacterium]|jgi:hypothetical protein|nr:hypothetical protein [Opitutaceae bacterium]
MNYIPITTNFWHAKTLGFEAKPVDLALCANPPGAGLFARTLEGVRGGLALLVFAGGLAASPTGLRGESSPNTTIHLTATLISPIDVSLEWKDPIPCVGHVPQMALKPDGPFYILAFCPPGQTKYIHPKLMPETTLYYRICPIFGPATNEVEVALPKSLPDAEYVDRFHKPEDYAWDAPKVLPDAGPVAKVSIRNPATAAAGAPTNFKATLVPSTVSGILFTWTNHSSDEEGFFLEEKTDDSSDFKVIATMGAKTNSFGIGFRPPQRSGTFRVRAYYFGEPSNLECRTTGN